ncbi:MAG: hypothetical protein JNM13_14215 [Hyphomicrobiaceae bacterium]|nr:hypothetical protein [Hyphomicrobiaceae bacterium]
MQGIIYEVANPLVFALVTLCLGGGAAWMTGRAVARGWGSLVNLFTYGLLLGAGVRFLHYALFGGTMFSFHYYLVDTALLMVLAFLSFRMTRVRQMTTQYRWLYEKTGPFGWRARPGA